MEAMPMRNFFLTLSCCCLALGCATEAGIQPDSQSVAPGAPSAQAPAPSSPAAPGVRRPVVFSDLPNFDRDLGQSLSGAKDPVVVTSADHISLRQLPPRL
jgi:hypothetical protein